MNFAEISSFFYSGKRDADVAIPGLLALRWGEIFCQIILLILVDLFMEMQIALVLVLPIIFYEVVSNLYLHMQQWSRKLISPLLIFIILFFDALVLTILLYVTGGVMNPFVFLYLLHIVVGTILLQEVLSWSITLVTLLCYGLLFYFPPPVITDLSGASRLGDLAGCHLIGGITGSFQIHLQGMWVAFAVTSCFIVFFVSKIQKRLAVHRMTLQNLEREEARNEKLSSLTTLAAGAAHELATPLSTVAVVSNEMIHALEDKECGQALLADAQLIRKQVTDCKEILYQMAAGAGEHLGEELERLPIEKLIPLIVNELSEKQRERIELGVQEDLGSIRIPVRSMCRTVKGLLINGLEASAATAKVDMHWTIAEEMLCIEITDRGTGIREEHLPMVKTAFFTTKKSGLGLGLFLAKNLAEQFHGRLQVYSKIGEGTKVTMTFSLEMLSHRK